MTEPARMALGLVLAAGLSGPGAFAGEDGPWQDMVLKRCLPSAFGFEVASTEGLQPVAPPGGAAFFGEEAKAVYLGGDGAVAMNVVGPGLCQVVAMGADHAGALADFADVWFLHPDAPFEEYVSTRDGLREFRTGASSGVLVLIEQSADKVLLTAGRFGG